MNDLYNMMKGLGMLMIKYQLGLSSEPITENPCALLDGVGLLRGEYLCRYKKEYFTIASCREYVKSYIENVLDIFSTQDKHEPEASRHGYRY